MVNKPNQIKNHKATDHYSGSYLAQETLNAVGFSPSLLFLPCMIFSRPFLLYNLYNAQYLIAWSPGRTENLPISGLH